MPADELAAPVRYRDRLNSQSYALLECRAGARQEMEGADRRTGIQDRNSLARQTARKGRSGSLDSALGVSASWTHPRRAVDQPAETAWVGSIGRFAGGCPC